MSEPTDELYFVCHRCAHVVLARDPDCCEHCRSIDLIGYYQLDDAEEHSERIMRESSIVRLRHYTNPSTPEPQSLRA